MNLRRTLVLLTVSAAAFTMSSAAQADPAVSDDGPRRVIDLDLPSAEMSAAAGGSLFTTVSPTRVLDTRSGAAVPGGGAISVDLSSRVPEGTTAVVLNLTGVAPTSATYVTVWPAEVTRPGVSNVNIVANETRANAVTVALGPSRTLNLYNAVGRIHLLADLSGYYAPQGEALYNARAPQRVLDTRNGGGPIPAGGTINVDTSRFLPSNGAKAITINLTVVSPTATTFVTAYRNGVTRPAVSSINAARGAVIANQVTVALGADKDIRLYNSAGNAHVIVDLVGDYDTTFGDSFYPVSPTRVVDTRTGLGALPGGYYFSFAVTEDPNSPEAQISAMVLNVTGTGGTAATYLTLYPSGSAVPDASTINLNARQSAANLATTALGWDTDELGTYYGFNVFNAVGSIHVVLDYAGYFAP
jgi:hypothetical protein